MSTPQQPPKPVVVEPKGPVTAGAPGGRPPGNVPAAPTKPGTPSGPGVVKRTTDTLKRVMLVVFGALAALFAILNRDSVDVDWIFGDKIQTPLILVIAVSLAVGAIIGWIVAKLGNRGN